MAFSPIRKGIRHSSMSHYLTLLDQAFYDGHRAVGQKEVMQVGWVYERPVDMDGLRRFHSHLSSGLLGRRVERSPLPFGRHRWVADPHPAPLSIATRPRSREDLSDWFDECTQSHIDPESGPSWRLSLLPLNDGATAVSLVLSHYIVDGIGSALAVSEASLGMRRDLGYFEPQSRSWIKAAVQDLAQTLTDGPGVARAVVVAAHEARRRREDVPRSGLPDAAMNNFTQAEARVITPSLTIQVKLAEWNNRAQGLNGSTNTLAAALTAQIDVMMGRRGDNGNDVPLLLTVNDRQTLDDARAVAVTFARLKLDPKNLTDDLTGSRALIKHALVELDKTPDRSSDLVALAPFTPTSAWRKLIDYALNDPEKPAVCSTLGDTGHAAIRPDGTLCDTVFARGISQHMTASWLNRIGSLLHVYCGTAAELGTVAICVNAYHPGSVHNKADLREIVVRALSEFGLTGDVG